MLTVSKSELAADVLGARQSTGLSKALEGTYKAPARVGGKLLPRMPSLKRSRGFEMEMATTQGWGMTLAWRGIHALTHCLAAVSSQRLCPRTAKSPKPLTPFPSPHFPGRRRAVAGPTLIPSGLGSESSTLKSNYSRPPGALLCPVPNPAQMAHGRKDKTHSG